MNKKQAGWLSWSGKILVSATLGLVPWLTSCGESSSTSTSVTPVPTATPTPVTSVAISNGSFESNDFTGWTRVGDTSVVTSSFGITPSQGSFQALITNRPSSLGSLAALSGVNAIPVSNLESFLGVASGALNRLNRGTVVEGSAIRVAFTARAGQVLSFDWNFLTDELPRNFNDFSFVTIVDTSPLADVLSPLLVNTTGSTPVLSQTRYQTFTFTVPADGNYTLGLGVVDVTDPTIQSALLIDNVRLQ